MKTWTTPPFRAHCGKCGAEIPADTRRQLITAPGEKWKLTRCENCATADAFTKPPTPDEKQA